jgi:hypothetical protein
LLIHWSFLVLVASCVIRERHVLSPVFSWAPIRQIGVVSYGFLYHAFALYIGYRSLRHLGVASEPAFFVVAIVLGWIIAEASYRLFEGRFLALKTRFGGAVLCPVS